MDYNEVLSKALKTIGIELKEEFDKNFENKSFFGKKWPPSDNGLVKTGDLRKSLRVQTSNSSVSIISDVEYADIHNEGGKIQVTDKMKKFFWAKYKETKSEKYKALALKKVGSFIIIPERRFVGDAPEVKKIVEDVITEQLNDFISSITKN
ncbi:MAG: phage virion morphogenesis protein [Bacteroidales bacterium]|nr:phage virion morphogenesis protein [Candidatus Scybalousia scybalohippi]